VEAKPAGVSAGCQFAVGHLVVVLPDDG